MTSCLGDSSFLFQIWKFNSLDHKPVAYASYFYLRFTKNWLRVSFFGVETNIILLGKLHSKGHFKYK